KQKISFGIATNEIHGVALIQWSAQEPMRLRPRPFQPNRPLQQFHERCFMIAEMRLDDFEMLVEQFTFGEIVAEGDQSINLEAFCLWEPGSELDNSSLRR